MSQKFNNTKLKEIHNTELDYVHAKTSSRLDSQANENENLAGNSLTIYNNQNPKPSQELLVADAYNWWDLSFALVTELLCCIINQLISHMSSSTIGFWAGHLSLVLIIYPVSGANMNAVMSLALWIYEEEFTLIHIIRRWGYIIIIQPLGVFLGQMLALVLVTKELKYIKDSDVEPIKIAWNEFMGTFFTIFCALQFIVSKYTRPSQIMALQFLWFGIAVFWTFDAGSNPTSGSRGAYNPTYYLISGAIAKQRGNKDVFKNWYCYVFPEILASLAATFLFKYVFDQKHYRLMNLKLKWESTFFNKQYIGIKFY